MIRIRMGTLSALPVAIVQSIVGLCTKSRGRNVNSSHHEDTAVVWLQEA